MTKRAEVCGVWSLHQASWSWARDKQDCAGTRNGGFPPSEFGVWDLGAGRPAAGSSAPVTKCHIDGSFGVSES